MRSAEDGGAVALSGAAREDVAGPVLLDRELRGAGPLREQRARLRIFGREEAAVDAVTGRAERGELRQTAGEGRRKHVQRYFSAGCCAIQCRAMSTRRATHTSLCSST